MSGSMMDYTMPRADNLPNIHVATEKAENCQTLFPEDCEHD